MVMLFCNIGWMKDYKGLRRTNDQIQNGGKHIDEYGSGGEVCNFLPYRSHLYGHVETLQGERDTKINIDKLGARPGAKYIDGVDVIWVATRPGGGRFVSGWYRNARVFRARQYFEDYIGVKYPTNQHELDGCKSFVIRGSAEDAYLIPETQRSIRLQRGSGWMGEKSWWYADEPDVAIKNFLKEVMEALADDVGRFQVGSHSVPPVGHKKPRQYTTETVAYLRDAEVTKYAKAKAAGRCDLCGNNAPFHTPKGFPFLECHHVVPLKDNGEDTVGNVVALCPNCHRRMHSLNSASDIAALKIRIEVRDKGVDAFDSVMDGS